MYLSEGNINSMWNSGLFKQNSGLLEHRAEVQGTIYHRFQVGRKVHYMSCPIFGSILWLIHPASNGMPNFFDVGNLPIVEKKINSYHLARLDYRD